MSGDMTNRPVAHFVLSANRHRPAIVAKMWPHTDHGAYANLVIFLDDESDERDLSAMRDSWTGTGPLL